VYAIYFGFQSSGGLTCFGNLEVIKISPS